MAVTLTILGHKPSTRDPDYGEMVATNLRATVYEAVSQHYWINKIGIIAGNQGSNSVIALEVMDSDGDPGVRLGSTADTTLTTAMADANGGQVVELTLNVSNALTTKGALLRSGTAPAIAVLDKTNAIRHGFLAASRFSATNKNLYTASGYSSLPSTFPSVTPSYEGWMSAWVVAYPNEEPRIPINRVPSGTITDTTPTFQGDFRDRNGAWGPANSGFDSGDQLKATQIRLYKRTSSTSRTKIWDITYNSTSSERSANQSTKTYPSTGVTSIVPGDLMEWEIRQQDQADAWSDWSDALQFTVGSAGSFTVTGPTGKQTILNPSLTATWNHASGTSLASVQVRLMSGSIVQKTSGTITKSVSAGSSFTVTFAEMGFSNLDWATPNLSFQILGTDTTAVQTSWWSGPVFYTNTPPPVPTNIYPAGDPVSALPLFSATMIDPDDVEGGPSMALTFEVSQRPVIANGSYQDGTTTKWTNPTTTAGVAKTFSAETALGADGDNRSGKLVVTTTTATNSESYILHDDEIPVVAAQVWTITAYLRSTVTGHHPLLYVQYYNSSHVATTQSKLADVTPTANVWQLRTLTTTVPAGSVYMRVGWYDLIPVIGTAGTVYADAFKASTLRTAVSAYNDTSGKWEKQATTTEMPQYGTYYLKAYGYDGIIYSGGQTSAATATRSVETQFVYALGPSLSITSPTNGGTVGSSQPNIVWVAATQVRYRVQIIDEGTGLTAWDSLWQVSSAQTTKPPSGRMVKGNVYTIRVSVEDAAPLSTTLQVSGITIVYTPPATLSASVEAVPVGIDPGLTSLKFNWEQTSEDSAVWQKYVIRRDDLDENLAEINSADVTEWVDYFPRSGRDYTYSVFQEINIDGQVLASDAVTVTGRIEIEGLSLVRVDSPETDRITFFAWRDQSYTADGQESTYLTWETEAPTPVGTQQEWENASVTAVIFNDGVRDVASYLDTVRRIVRINEIFCLRDSLGNRSFKYVPKKGFVWTRLQKYLNGDPIIEVQLDMNDANFNEGVIDALGT